MLRKTLISAVVLIASAPVGQAVAEVFYAPYEILADHPDCSGLGKIAFRVSYEAKAFISYPYPASVDVCTIGVRKGDKFEQTTIDCAGKQAAPESANSLDREYKAILSDLPDTAYAKGVLDLCLGVSGGVVLSNESQFDLALSDRKVAMLTAIDETSIAVRFRDRWIFENAQPESTGEPPFLLWISYPLLKFDVDEGAAKKLGLVADLSLMLEERSIADCQEPGSDCFAAINASDSERFLKDYTGHGIRNDFGLGSCYFEPPKLGKQECPK